VSLSLGLPGTASLSREVHLRGVPLPAGRLNIQSEKSRSGFSFLPSASQRTEQNKELPQGGRGNSLLQKSFKVLVASLFILGSCTFFANAATAAATAASEQAVSYFNELKCCLGLP
jgi:hypothetical protein